MPMCMQGNVWNWVSLERGTNPLVVLTMLRLCNMKRLAWNTTCTLNMWLYVYICMDLGRFLFQLFSLGASKRFSISTNVKIERFSLKKFFVFLLGMHSRSTWDQSINWVPNILVNEANIKAVI